MPEDPTTIEVEVLEIDGQPAPPAAEKPQGTRARPWPQGAGDWRGWSTSLSRLDRRWWPLWVLLALLGVVLLAIVGVVAACFWVVSTIVRVLLRAVGLTPPLRGPTSTTLR